MATQYEQVQKILGDAAGGAHPNHGGDGRFWELSLTKFRKLTIYGVQLIADAGPKRGERSGLIMAIKGTGPFASGGTFPRMPLGRPPIPPEQITYIQDWIDAGLPNDEAEEKEPDEVIVPRDGGYAPDTLKASPTKAPHRPCVTNANLYRETAGTVKLRKNIDSMSPEEITTYKAAIQALKDLPDADSRNYRVQATIHGDWCRHSSEIFLPWHRAYLYRFELLLQEFYPGVTIPYWDWTATRKIPDAFATNGSNTLFDATRTPAAPASLPTTAEINTLQAVNNFPDYGGGDPFGAGQLESPPHNFVHVWVGGNMSQVPQAAFDPLFWSHHCNVDRLWAEWQETNNGKPVQNGSMEPFGMTPSQVEVVTDLGYTYAASDATFVVDASEGNSQYTSGKTKVAPYLVNNGYKKAYVHLHNVQYPEDSYVVNVYLNAPQAGCSTKTKGNPNYAGRFATFGHGMCIGGPGHCDPKKRRLHKYDHRDPHHYEPYPVKVDITDCLKKITGAAKKRGKACEVQVSLVAVAADGSAMPDDALRFDSLSLVIEG